MAKTEAALTDLIAALLDKADEHADSVMPGFTHLQTAQPVTFGHHCMAYVEMFGRDRSRVSPCHRTSGRMPDWCRSACRTGFKIDRHMTAEALGFRSPTAIPSIRFRSRFCAGVSLGRRNLCRSPVALCRRDRHLVDAAIRLHPPVGCIFDRLFHHAAEKEPGCG